MIAILLCGGFATRLHPLTQQMPNALLDVAGRPLIDYTMDRLLELPELEAVHLVSNSRFTGRFYGWQAAWRGLLEERGVDLVLHNDGALDEPSRRGEVGDLAFALRILGQPEAALVMSGDTIYRFSLRKLWDAFRAGDAHLVLGVPEDHPQVLQQRSVIRFGDDDLLQEVFHHPDEPPTNWVCPPLYFLRGSAFPLVAEYLAEDGDPDALDLFVGYLAGREPVRVQALPGREWRIRINTRFMYEQANQLFAAEQVMVEEGGA